MAVIPFPEHPAAPGPVDPLESALLSAWNNSPDVMDDYRDTEPDDVAEPGRDPEER
ncbi:hypothetical protein K4749_22875 [Streptomyces sp. TRM72054]|uniref:hypothetical protein n=1 Tax=Streptomyces sp. TRM72054 TaxID=2870562 RepID=UPI001C8C6179|nr:hypothetical protein [Streptomyces sp. TRM72054]MBX9396358.1 hypothetical protein [Streptomyces sp. TRM72054]